MHVLKIFLQASDFILLMAALDEWDFLILIKQLLPFSFSISAFVPRTFLHISEYEVILSCSL